MLSAVEIFTICVVLLFGAPTLNGKNENVTQFEKAVNTFNYVLITAHPVDYLLPTEVGINKGLKLVDHHQINGEENHRLKLNNQLRTDAEKNQGTELNVQETGAQEREVHLPTNVEEDSNLTLKIYLDNHNVKDSQEKDYKKQPVRKQDRPEGELEDQLKDATKAKNQHRIQIQLSEDRKMDQERGENGTWTKLQTRAKGTLLGLKKRTFKNPWSSFVKSTLSLGKKLSIRKDKQFRASLESQASLSEETQSVPTDAFITRPWKGKPESPPRKPPRTDSRGAAPWVPPKEPFEPFCLTDSIKNIVMIPGSGEFVYDTVTERRIPNKRSSFEQPQTINENNDKRMSDAMLSLEQLNKDLPKVEWVSVVVNWFGDSLNIQKCKIYPAVEFNDGYTVSPDDWRVDNIKRINARLVSRDSDGNPKYGGTVSDGALKRYINELHQRGYKVMLYPMLVLDTEDKDWRGKLTGPYYEISFFFRNIYNRFITHYATLAGQVGVEGFIIGSEFVGLTKVRGKDGSFPAVTELVNLAKEVRNILGRSAILSYAADWTEYHISSNGRYPLDELWASDDIDVVGINAYFPLIDDPDPPGGLTVQDAIRSWTTGEGYHYYYDYSKTPPAMVMYPEKEHSKWAWKNIEKWWSESHYNPDSSKTAWRPKMKKIWFTEFGYPSVDGCSNEPHVFVDGSRESKYPRYSNKQVSFQAQRVAIEGTLRKWQNSEAVEKMFLYAWDARPFPYFPNQLDIWSDGANWKSGHWVQGKIQALQGSKREDVVTLQRTLSQPVERPPSPNSGATRRRRGGGKSSR